MTKTQFYKPGKQLEGWIKWILGYCEWSDDCAKRWREDVPSGIYNGDEYVFSRIERDGSIDNSGARSYQDYYFTEKMKNKKCSIPDVQVDGFDLYTEYDKDYFDLLNRIKDLDPL